MLKTKNAAITFVILLMVVVAIFFAVRGYSQTQSPEPVSQVDQSLSQALATEPSAQSSQAQISSADLPSQGWTFEGFVDGRSDWGTFINVNGSRVKAKCSAPLSPQPAVGADYIWDKNTNILYPVVDNSQGNIQRFWYPEVVP